MPRPGTVSLRVSGSSPFSDQRRRRNVRILDEDPELGEELTPEQFEGARRHAVAEVSELAIGAHDPADVGNARLLGMLVLDGLIIRQVLVAERQCGELVGPGSLLRPWDVQDEHAPMPFEIRWRVIQPVRLALLDDRTVSVAARWPRLMQAIVRRAVERSHTLAFNVAIHCLQHVDLRLLVLFWHLADRFGRVTPEGTLVPLKLTHADLSELVGARRPSVSSGLAELRRQGKLLRRPDRTWLLLGEPPEELFDLKVVRRAG